MRRLWSELCMPRRRRPTERGTIYNSLGDDDGYINNAEEYA